MTLYPGGWEEKHFFSWLLLLDFTWKASTPEFSNEQATSALPPMLPFCLVGSPFPLLSPMSSFSFSSSQASTYISTPLTISPTESKPTPFCTTMTPESLTCKPGPSLRFQSGPKLPPGHLHQNVCKLLKCKMSKIPQKPACPLDHIYDTGSYLSISHFLKVVKC